jgi:hypothetical protein
MSPWVGRVSLISTATIQIQAENVKADILLFAKSVIKKLRQGYDGKKVFLSSDTIEKRVVHVNVCLREKQEKKVKCFEACFEIVCRTVKPSRQIYPAFVH